MSILYKKSMKEFKGTWKCKIRYFALSYDNNCPIYEKTKYGVGY